MNYRNLLILIAGSIALTACSPKSTGSGPDIVQTSVQQLELPPPYDTKSVFHLSKVIGWPEGVQPVAPPGFEVTKFADSLRSARWIYVLPNGDVLIAQANTEHKGIVKVAGALVGLHKSGNTSNSPNQITLLRDTDGDGYPDVRKVFLSGLNMPLGMLLVRDQFYVAVTDGLIRYPYAAGQTTIESPGTKILDLPAGGYNNHWTRNIIISPDSSKIYVSVGSASNVGEYGMEEEIRRAAILEINLDGSAERIFASGLRNPVGMDWEPVSGQLWTAVNERDKLGDELVPDYATSVQDGAFYGWPYSYYGQNPDPRFSEKEQRFDLVSKALVPDVALGAHTASLGLAFNRHQVFPEKYHGGAFIGQHGSWNRSELNGYKIAFIPFKDGRPAGPPEDFLTGFIHNISKREVYGRPVCVAFLPDGSLLMTDDASNVVWRVRYVGKK
jgi:glucose/arabinose dehydrogenase